MRRRAASTERDELELTAHHRPQAPVINPSGRTLEPVVDRLNRRSRFGRRWC